MGSLSGLKRWKRPLKANLNKYPNSSHQVSKQADIVSVRQAYPTLGQPKFVTYNGGPWKGRAGKGGQERWVDVYIDPVSVGEFSTDQIDQLVEELKTSGYTPLPGMFGIGGPYVTGYGPLGNSLRTTVFYFDRSSQPMAHNVAATASRILSIEAVEPQFVDVSDVQQKDIVFLIENSGLDLQLYLVGR